MTDKVSGKATDGTPEKGNNESLRTPESGTVKPLLGTDGAPLKPTTETEGVVIEELRRPTLDEVINDKWPDLDKLEYPASVTRYIPAGPRVLIEMTFHDFSARMLLMDSIPDKLPNRPTYRIMGSTSKDFRIGSEVVLDTYSGGSETKIFDDENKLSFVSWRAILKAMDNAARSEFFEQHPTVEVIEHFVILQGNIAAIKTL